MADPGKGRGRGLALLQALKKSQLMDTPPSSEETTPAPTPGPSVAPSVVNSATSTSTVGGRGRIAAMMLSKMQQKPGAPSFSPASDVSPSAPPPATAATRGAGRGIKLLQTLQAQQSQKLAAGGDVHEVVQKMAESSIGSTTMSTTKSSVAKNKCFREVKETPPVVMKGESGSRCEVTSNFIYLNFEENNVFEYEVKYDPDQDYKSMRFKLLNEHHHYFKQKTFDGTTLYVPHKLPDEATSLVSTNPFDNSKVQITIIFRRTRRLSEMVHLYNVLFKHIMKDLQLIRFGRQHFNQNSAIQIPQHKLEVWPGILLGLPRFCSASGMFCEARTDGFRAIMRKRTASLLHRVRGSSNSILKAIAEKPDCPILRHWIQTHLYVPVASDGQYVTAVDEYEGGLMLTLDSTHRVLRTQSVLSLINELLRSEGANWKRAMSDKLVGCSVMTTYNNKLFRVDSIDDTMTPKSTFEKNEKGTLIKISYIDYYKKNYGIDIMDWEQPMLISRETKRTPGSEAPTDFMICLVPELCQLTGLSDDQRSNFRLMKDVATYTRITPNQRHAAFKKFIQNVLENETACNRLKGWGLSLAPETINITARTLPPEPLHFGNNVQISGKPNADWNGEVTRHPVMQAVDILHWAVLFTDRDKNVTNDFLETLRRCCGPMGIKVSNPQMVRLPNDRTDTYIQALKKTINSTVQLVVAICSVARDDRYAAIKRICCAENPVPSQVINARTIMNQAKIRSITQKILLQINCKLGGTLWNISIPFKTAMIVGIDSYHDADRNKRSVCSFIASYNQTMTHWYSKAVFQERGQEIADSLKSCLVDALKHYLRTNGRLPDKIIMYRDGVGDGQLKMIRDYEIPQMQVSFSLVGETYKPSLCYIVVQKRINTRIFMKAGSGFENPHPGTVVDHAITRRDWYDFLIASQKVNQGTVTPTHYVVVYDDTGMSPDQCQRMTYKMCHLYYNWPGTVRVPAPCQYAHKLSYLVGQNIRQEPSDVLSDRLFFL